MYTELELAMPGTDDRTVEKPTTTADEEDDGPPYGTDCDIGEAADGEMLELRAVTEVWPPYGGGV